MPMNKFLVVLLLALCPVYFSQATEIPINNAGFTQSNIWYSKDPFYTGNAIRIYTFVYNGSVYDLTGDVEFLDNDTTVIGKTSFSLSGGGRGQDAWVNWVATPGDHVITARLVNVIADGPSGKQAVVLNNSETGKSTRQVATDPLVVAAQTQVQVKQVVDTGAQTVGAVQNVVQSTVTNVGQVIPIPVKQSVSTGVSAIESFRIAEAAQLEAVKESKKQEIAAIEGVSSTASSTSMYSNIASKENASKGDDLAISATTAAKGNVSKGSVAALSTKTATSTTEKSLAYVELGALTAAQYFFEWPVIFYGVILYIVYRFLRWGIMKVRNRE